jgi:ribA/ribD-fused uncharacterized protein
MSKEIRFFSHSTRYFELSNFYMRNFTINGQVWPSVEHYFQAMKFPFNPEYQESIRRAPKPYLAKRMGNSRRYRLAPHWDAQGRLDAMKKAIKAKFIQNPDLKKLLLDTGDAILIEGNINDEFWGCGRDDNGMNMLGKMLMELRRQIIKQTFEQRSVPF